MTQNESCVCIHAVGGLVVKATGPGFKNVQYVLDSSMVAGVRRRAGKKGFFKDFIDLGTAVAFCALYSLLHRENVCSALWTLSGLVCPAQLHCSQYAGYTAPFRGRITAVKYNNIFNIFNQSLHCS